MKLHTTRPRAVEWTLIGGILILAAVLRLGAPGIVEFWRDEANLSERALSLARGHEFPLLSIDSSVGIPSGPMSVYLLAIPYFFNSDPMVATEFIAVLNIVAVGLTYFLTRRYYGTLAACVAALLLAVSPWNVLYSRRIWQPDMLPLFVLLMIAAGLFGFVEGKRWGQLLHLPLLAILGQTHYITVLLVPISIYLIWFGRKHWTRFFAFSFVLTALIFIPYTVGLVQHGLVSVESVKKVLSSGAASAGEKQGITLTDAAIHGATFLIAGTELHQMIGPKNALDFLHIVSSATVFPLLSILTVLVLASAFWIIIRAIRYPDGRTPVDLTFLMLLVLMPLLLSITWTRFNFYYLNPMLPGAFIVLAIGISDLWKTLAERIIGKFTMRRVVVGAGIAALAALIVTQIWLLNTLFGYISTHNTDDGTNTQLNEFLVGFSTPLGFYEPIRSAILDQKPKAVLANLDGQYIGYNQLTTSWNILLYDVPSVRFLDGNMDVYPADQAVVLSLNCDKAKAGTKENKQIFKLRPGDPCYSVNTRTNSDLDLSAYTAANDAALTFANSAKVIAYRWEPKTGTLTLVWTIGKNPGDIDFSFAVHFLNASGDKFLTADGLSWRGRYWRTGDTVINRFQLKDGLDRVAEIAGVRIGMYIKEDTAQGPQFYMQDLYDRNGGVAGQFIDIKFR